MVLFLLAISFAHFRADHDTGGWSGEAALHHAAIPLALFVLLQDYRFVIADAFIRFLSSALLAGITVWSAWALETRLSFYPSATSQPFYTGLLFIGSCALISAFAFARNRLQRALTKVVFLRQSGSGARRITQWRVVLRAVLGDDGRFFQRPLSLPTRRG